MKYYAFEHDYGRRISVHNRPVGSLLTFETAAERDAFVDAGPPDPDTPGHREPFMSATPGPFTRAALVLTMLAAYLRPSIRHRA